MPSNAALGLVWLFAISFLTGCARPVTRTPPPQPPSSRVVALLNSIDEAKQRARTGELTVIIRSADRPEIALEEGFVDLINARGDTVTAHTDARGIAQFTTTDTTEYVLRVRRVGAAMYRGVYRPRPGCHERLEIYMGEIRIDESPGEHYVTRTRVILTTCVPDSLAPLNPQRDRLVR